MMNGKNKSLGNFIQEGSLQLNIEEGSLSLKDFTKNTPYLNRSSSFDFSFSAMGPLNALTIEKLNFKIEYYYQKSHRNSYYLMCGFYYKLTKQKRKEKEYMSLFNLEECRYSYEEFITVFYLIYSFHNTTIEADKREFKERYFKAVKNLDYAYFYKFKPNKESSV